MSLALILTFNHLYITPLTTYKTLDVQLALSYGIHLTVTCFWPNFKKICSNASKICVSCI